MITKAKMECRCSDYDARFDSGSMGADMNMWLLTVRLLNCKVVNERRMLVHFGRFCAQKGAIMSKRLGTVGIVWKL